MEQNFLKSRITFFVVALFPLFAVGQSNFINNQFWLQMPLYNPAASGVFNDLEVATGMQFGSDLQYSDKTSIDEQAPETYLRGDVFLSKINSGIGLNYYTNNTDHLFNKEENYRSRQQFGLNYNYQFRFKNGQVLSAGLCFSALNTNWNIDWNGPTPGPDPVFPPKTGSTTAYNFGAGTLYKSKNWFAGVSLNPMIKTNEADAMLYNGTYISFLTGADVLLGQKFKLTSNMLLTSYFDNDFTINVMMQCMYNERVYMGGGLLTSNYNGLDSWQAILGVRIAKKYLVHYAYGQVISDLNVSGKAIHNIAFQFVLGTF